MKLIAATFVFVSALTACGATNQPALSGSKPDIHSTLPPPQAMSSELASEVGWIFAVLTPDPRTQAAIRIVELKRADDFMEACMADQGVPYARRTLQIDEAQFRMSAVVAGWWAQPYVGDPGSRSRSGRHG